MSFCSTCEGLGTRLRNLENGSGGVWTLETNQNTFVPAVTVPVSDWSVLYFEFWAVCRAADGSGRAGFKRSGVIYKEGGTVLMQGPNWHTDFTSKSEKSYDVSFILGTSNITLGVIPAISGLVRWSGSLNVRTIS
jgi:hypothetical protein